MEFPGVSPPGRSVRLVGFVVLLAVYAVAAFYPFEFVAPRSDVNPVERLPDDGGLLIGGIGVARTALPPDWIDEVVADGSFRLRLRVVPATLLTDGSARIFTVSRSHSSRNLTVAQDGAALDLRLRRPGSNGNGMPALRVEDVFVASTPVTIDVTAAEGTLVVQIDGEPRLTRALPERPFRDWDRAYRLSLGNELDPDREDTMNTCRRFGLPCGFLVEPVVASDDKAWRGVVREARFGSASGSIDYLAAGALEIPARRWELREDPTFSVTRVNPRDLVLNLFGFIPLGFWLAYGRRTGVWRTLIAAAALSFLVSFGLELVQFFIPQRTSALPDIVTNVAGGVLGSALALRIPLFAARGSRAR